MDGSKRSSKANAFFTGFGAYKRIVLFDTLVEKFSVPEVVSVLAHEMGHFKKKHIHKGIVFSLITAGVMFWVFSFFNGNMQLLSVFGFTVPSVYAALIAFSFLYSPVSMAVSVWFNSLSRKYEYEADFYAARFDAAAMINALKKLSVENLSNLTPAKIKVFLEYSHPPVLERIRAIRSLGNKV